MAKSGGIYKNKYMVGDWTEIVVTAGGVDYTLGSTKNTILVVTNRMYVHKGNVGGFQIPDSIFHSIIGIEIRGRLEEINVVNVRMLLDKLPTGANQIDHGVEETPMEFVTVHGRRPNGLGDEDIAVEFCLWKCKSAEVTKIGSTDECASIQFAFKGCDDSDGDYGGNPEQPYGWIYPVKQEVSPMSVTWTAIPSSIIPATDNTYDIGSLSKRWRRLFLSQYISMGGFDPVSIAAPNISVYVDSADGYALKYKNNLGLIFDLTDTKASTQTPAVYDANTEVNYPAGLPDGTTDSIDIASPTTGDEFPEGFIGKVTLVDADSIGAGDVRVQIYNDKLRTDLVFEQYFDLAVTPLTAVIPAHFLSDGVDGDAAMYIDITNSTGVTADFQVAVRLAGIMTGSVWGGGSGTGVGSANARDGIGWDGTGLYTDLLTNGGLTLAGVTPNKKLAIAVGNGLSVGATLELDTTIAMVLNEAQIVTAMKRYNAGTIGMIPHGSIIGPPITGTWAIGDLFVDVNLLMWRCIGAGTPGTWQFFGTAYYQNIDMSISAEILNAAYTGEIAAGSYEDVSISINADFGFLQKMNVWGSDAAFGASNLDQPFRVALYPNETYCEREMMWLIQGQARKTWITGNLTGGIDDTILVDTVDHGTEYELVRLRTNTVDHEGEEYGRIIARATGVAPAYTLGEAVENDFVGGADVAMFVTEFDHRPFFCNSAFQPRTLFFRFFNDGASAMVIGYQYDLFLCGGTVS